MTRLGWVNKQRECRALVAGAAGWMGRVPSLPPDGKKGFPWPPPVKHQRKNALGGRFFRSEVSS